MPVDIAGGRFYPNGINPERAYSKDTLWLKIIPRKFQINDVNRRIDNSSDETVREEPLWFLMPFEWSYSISHQWEELTTPASALRDIASKFSNQARLASGTIGGLTDGAVGGAITIGDKADNPLLYSNSTRREFKVNLEFSVYNSTYNDVYVPVQNMVEYSCPEINSDFTEFSYPYVFSLQTFTGSGEAVDIISVKTVGLNNVLPSYKGPWIDGYPSYASLDLDFIDANPLYRSTLTSERSKKITVRTKNSTLIGVGSRNGGNNGS